MVILVEKASLVVWRILEQVVYHGFWFLHAQTMWGAALRHC